MWFLSPHPFFLFPIFRLFHLLGSRLYSRHVCQHFLLRYHRVSIIVVLRWSLLAKQTGLSFRRVRKSAKNDCQLRHISVCLSVCLSVSPNGKTVLSLGQIFTKTLHFSISRKYVEKTQVSLKYGKNNGYFTWSLIPVYDNMSLHSSYNEKCFGQKL
jgi:hypothetical protein